ncbi:MAG TPA: acetylxylan esterase [Pseudolysinimonas sp.]|jgi:cephalosporin-C deacetylase|nr:acetylxylan esterase [Pseudolysinimonas sp.]
MTLLDLPLGELQDYRPAVRRPADFDEFWRQTLAEARTLAAPPVFALRESPLIGVRVYDATFSGFGGEPVSGWLLTPTGRSRGTVIEYLGYGSGRGLSHERLAWVSAGFAHLVVDTRQLGRGGFLTEGLEGAEHYFYRRLFTDAVLAVDAVRAAPVDAPAILITGTSQGGGVALAVAGLSTGLTAVMPDVPFLCDFARGMELSDARPGYGDLVRYLSVHRDAEERVLDTLSYFDGVNFARVATTPALFSVGLRDPVCPPSTVFAAANAYVGAQVVVYPYNAHDGGGAHHWRRQVEWAAGV